MARPLKNFCGFPKLQTRKMSKLLIRYIGRPGDVTRGRNREGRGGADCAHIIIINFLKKKKIYTKQTLKHVFFWGGEVGRIIFDISLNHVSNYVSSGDCDWGNI